MSWGEPQQPPPFDANDSYAQPGHPQTGFAGCPATPPQKGNGALIAIVVGALVVVSGGVVAAIVLTGRHKGDGPVASSNRSVDLAAPTSVSGLTKLTGTVGGGTVTTILIDEPRDRLSPAEQSQLTSLGSASAIVAEIMSRADVRDARTEPTSAADGALSCGDMSTSGNGVTICFWYDGASFGTLEYLDGTSPQHAAPVADAVRKAAEG